MSADPQSSPRASALAVSYERGAERVRAAIAVALEPGSGFAERVEAALRSALGLLAAEPELAHLLVVRPFAGDAEALSCYERWQRRCAEALREAAARDPSAYDHPPFFEPALVSDLCAQVARQLGVDPRRLEELLPGLLELIHACYFGPERAARLVDA
ncbi:MAG TPA: hypothetical protein VF245_08980 [Solirubrobacterales bacterium]